MSNTMNPVVHFELPAEDAKRMADFYTKVFGWQMQMMGPEMQNYVVATTTESDEKGPKKPGAINGGFFPKSASNNKYPSVVIQVPDIHAHIKKIKEEGGELMGEPVQIPHVGWYVSFKDTEGNALSILQGEK